MGISLAHTLGYANEKLKACDGDRGALNGSAGVERFVLNRIAGYSTKSRGQPVMQLLSSRQPAKRVASSFLIQRLMAPM